MRGSGDSDTWVSSWVGVGLLAKVDSSQNSITLKNLMTCINRLVQCKSHATNPCFSVLLLSYSALNVTHFERQLQNLQEFIKHFSLWISAYNLPWINTSVKGFSVSTSLFPLSSRCTLQTLHHIRKKKQPHKLVRKHQGEKFSRSNTTLIWECNNRSIASERKQIIIPFYSVPGSPQMGTLPLSSITFKETYRHTGKSMKMSKNTRD